MNLVKAIIAIIAMVSLGQSAHGGDRWSLDLRAGASFPTQDLGSLELDTGIGLEATVAYRFLAHLDAYGGWGWTRFGASGDLDVETTGYAFGLRFVHPMATGSSLRYLVRLGGLYNHIELEDADGDIVGDSGHGLGWEAGLGLAIPLGDRWDLTPGVRYRALSRDIDTGMSNESVDLTDVMVDVGAAFTF